MSESSSVAATVADYCERCGEKLDSSKAVWLELNTNTGLYHGEGKFPEGGLSQGGFAFGPACARAVLKAGGKNNRIGRAAR